jgi:hypothetical protein
LNEDFKEWVDNGRVGPILKCRQAMSTIFYFNNPDEEIEEPEEKPTKRIKLDLNVDE